MNNNALLIVDPQVDFITGTMPIPGAEKAMNHLGAFMLAYGNMYKWVIVTADHHPFNHCSFKEYGGKWPRHCVHDSIGAAVWQPVMDSLYDTPGEVIFLYKGMNPRTEEYSIFKNDISAAHLASLIHEKKIERIDVCGLSGDVCVADTLTDGIAIYGAGMFAVLPEYTASLDGGMRLNDIILKNNLPCVSY